MDTTAISTSSSDLSSVDNALSATQTMMQTAMEQQQQLNQMKMEFDGIMSQLAMQTSIEEKITSTMEKQASAIQN